MNGFTSIVRYVIAALLLAGSMLTSGAACADDTEIFESHSCEKYRFVFIVDNSGSMSPTEFTQSKSTIDAVISEVLNSGLDDVQVAVVQYGSNNAGSVHTYNITIPFTDDESTALTWNRAYGTYGTVNSTYYQDHQPASLAAMRLDNVYAPGGALDITDGTNVQFVFFTDAWRDYSYSWCCTSLVADSYNNIPSHVLPGLGEYNVLKDGSVLPGGIKGQFTLLHVAPNAEARAAGAAIASVGGAYMGTVESNPTDPDGSGTTPRRYIEGSLQSTDTDLILSLVQDVIKDIKSDATFTAPVITLDKFTRLNHRDDVYFALFGPKEDVEWDGNLKRYQFSGMPPRIVDANGDDAIDATTGTFSDNAQSFWSDSIDGPAVALGGAAGELDISDRRVTTYTGSSTALLHSTNRVHETNAAVTAAMLSTDNSTRQDVLTWARGVDVNDDDLDGNTSEDRKHIGDPLHSTPALITYGDSTDGPESVVYFGTNEGYLHAIDTRNGKEKFSWIPPQRLPVVTDYYGQTETVTSTSTSSSDVRRYLRHKNRNQPVERVDDYNMNTTTGTGDVFIIEEVGTYAGFYPIVTMKHEDTGKYLTRNGWYTYLSSTITSASQWVVQDRGGSNWYYAYDGSWWRLYVDGAGRLGTNGGNGSSNDFIEDVAPEPVVEDTEIAKPYGLDGPISTWVNDTNNDGTIDTTDDDHVYLFIGERRGGRNYYALDVSDPDNPEYMWTIEGGSGDFSELGQTWSKPTLTNIRIDGDSTTVLIFGAGYDPAQDDKATRSADSYGRGLFIVEAETGLLLWRASVDTSGSKTFTDLQYSMPADPALFDYDGDGYLNQIYIGDMGGQIWRFDVDQNAEIWSEAITGGVVADLAADDAAGNRRFYNRPDIALIKYQSTNYVYVSIGSGFRAHPLDETIDDRFYVFRQKDWIGLPEGYGFNDGTLAEPAYRPILESDLYDVTANTIVEGDEQERQEAKDELASLQGWKLHLTTSGEKALAPSVTFNYQVLFTTYVPSEAALACSASVGSGRVYALNLLDGTPASTFDETLTNSSDSDLTAEDRYKALVRTGIPTQPYVYFPEGESPVVMVGPEQVEGVTTGSMVQRHYWYEVADF